VFLPVFGDSPNESTKQEAVKRSCKRRWVHLDFRSIQVEVMIKIGVIGYGYWGPNLVRNFCDCAEAEVVAVDR